MSIPRRNTFCNSVNPTKCPSGEAEKQLTHANGGISGCGEADLDSSSSSGGCGGGRSCTNGGAGFQTGSGVSADLENVFGLQFFVRTSLSEVDRYLREEPIGLEENPLAWWAEKATRYPRVARLARRLLSLPLSALPGLDRALVTVLAAEAVGDSPRTRSLCDGSEGRSTRVALEASVKQRACKSGRKQSTLGRVRSADLEASGLDLDCPHEATIPFSGCIQGSEALRGGNNSVSFNASSGQEGVTAAELERRPEAKMYKGQCAIWPTCESTVRGRIGRRLLQALCDSPPTSAVSRKRGVKENNCEVAVEEISQEEIALPAEQEGIKKKKKRNRKNELEDEELESKISSEAITYTATPQQRQGIRTGLFDDAMKNFGLSDTVDPLRVKLNQIAPEDMEIYTFLWHNWKYTGIK
ncbi:unnamed protein product [Protopolystoma xenopodis]|uniref:HAT C-terminal dimerisation domain-containing protein n=1 Tax=Protopolystoma xenopodis TaxID=117903 RepID=A0A3S5B5R3_9PLAT|nr:unnamed protein product [Protopolystoma xenopodis]